MARCNREYTIQAKSCQVLCHFFRAILLRCGGGVFSVAVVVVFVVVTVAVAVAYLPQTPHNEHNGCE